MAADPDSFRSYSEFERRYLPRTVAKRERDNETPAEAGRRIARDVIPDAMSEEAESDV